MTGPSGVPIETGYLPREGTELYYEVQGRGSPVLFIHGAFGSGRAFRALLPSLTRSHRVLLVDLQGHGRTADRDEGLSYERLADDCAAVARHLAPGGCAVVGFSLGGGTALQLAFRHPGLVKRLAVLGAPFRQSGWHPGVLAGFRRLTADRAAEFMASEMYLNHVALAPRPEEFPVLLNKLGELLGWHDYDWTEQVRALDVPTLIGVGDGDSLSPHHAAEFFALRGGGLDDAGAPAGGADRSSLAVLPAVGHSDILQSELLAACLSVFLADR